MVNIEFRGMYKRNGTMGYGNLICHATGTFINACNYYNEVISETVGQYIGRDKNGEKVFAGDIIQYNNGYNTGYIVWSESNLAYMCVEEGGNHKEWLCSIPEFEVIGNIHEDPELLEVERD